MDVRKYTANKIKEYRKLNRMTQKELGEKIGVKHNTISGYENGTSEPEQDLLFKIAAALNININDLFPQTDGYYTSPEVAEYANKLKNNPDMRLLFDAAEDMTKDDIDFVVNMIENLKKREGK